MVTYRNNWGEDRVYFHNSAGCLSSIPAWWTTVVAPDPFVAVAGSRCFFRYEDLIQLVELMEKLRSDGPETVKDITPRKRHSKPCGNKEL
jgi:hypothetical protein